ncbi:FK506-binding protein 59 [Plutella xylostella]|uniref:FK506-binding protein 59 n=1 Tax=Plutella xylostella TaxID=51655 RepID=UPI002032CB86|nr:FK506-binding protein 59 [Plutella xylostella]
MTVDEGVDISKAQDRGVLKRILKEGEGTETPTAGCFVRVHYTGTLLDGSKFDSSRDRNEPFEFQLGKGSVIKAWDIGIATMKKGEVCILTCAPAYAYGDSDKTPKIPPNSTLQFEVEMLEWHGEDLSPNKSKGILRHIVEQGEGFDTPNDGALVTVELEGKLLSDGKVFDTRTLTFPLGEGGEVNVPDGLERALEKFLKGEKSRVTLKPKYAFKSEGNAVLGVPSNSSVEYTVKLTNFERAKESWAMDGPEKLEQAKIYKEKGTNYFKQSKYLLAIKMYKKVVTLVDDIPADTSETEENKKLADEYLLSSHLNLSLVYLKVSPPHYFEARDHATKALDKDENNVKGLFRRGQALLGMGETEQAMKDFQQVLSAEPQNKAASNQLIICRSTIQKQKQKEKQLYANMFDKFAKHDVQAEKERAKAEVDVIGDAVGEWGAGEGEWTDQQRAREPTEFEKENPNILLLDKEGQFKNM